MLILTKNHSVNITSYQVCLFVCGYETYMDVLNGMQVIWLPIWLSCYELYFEFRKK